MKSYARKLWCILLCTLMITALLPLTAKADTGPKPSVHVAFRGLGDTTCYATLLSSVQSTGPHSALDPGDSLPSTEEPYGEANLAFTKYQDADGFYYLQQLWKVSDSSELVWGYYPPDEFKILLYFPEENLFVSSGIYTSYAFDSYYTVDMTGVPLSGGSTASEQPILAAVQLTAERSYPYGPELLSLLARIAITIVIEVGLALLFGFRKKELAFLALVNVATQVLLNVVLNIFRYAYGSFALVAGYILLEIAVVILEAVLYCTLMKKVCPPPEKKRHPIVYALVANAASLYAGIKLAELLPGIF